MGKMKRYVIEDPQNIAPFNQPARELNVLNKPLWLSQRDVLNPYCEGEIPVAALSDVPLAAEPMIVHRDNLFFDEAFIASFMEQAMLTGAACRAAFRPTDDAFMKYAVPLSRRVQAVYKRAENGRNKDLHSTGHGWGERGEIDHYVIDLWYYPEGYHPNTPVTPIFISSECKEVGYYSVPDYMAERGDLTHFVTKRSFISVENWVHGRTNAVAGHVGTGAGGQKLCDQPDGHHPGAGVHRRQRDDWPRRGDPGVHHRQQREYRPGLQPATVGDRG
jgi:hypothetical protein